MVAPILVSCSLHKDTAIEMLSCVLAKDGRAAAESLWSASLLRAKSLPLGAAQSVQTRLRHIQVAAGITFATSMYCFPVSETMQMSSGVYAGEAQLARRLKLLLPGVPLVKCCCFDDNDSDIAGCRGYGGHRLSEKAHSSSCILRVAVHVQQQKVSLLSYRVSCSNNSETFFTRQ